MRWLLLSLLSLTAFNAIGQQRERNNSRYQLDLSRPWEEKASTKKQIVDYPAPILSRESANPGAAPATKSERYVYKMPIADTDSTVEKNMPVIVPDSSAQYSTPVLRLENRNVPESK